MMRILQEPVKLRSRLPTLGRYLASGRHHCTTSRVSSHFKCKKQCGQNRNFSNKLSLFENKRSFGTSHPNKSETAEETITETISSSEQENSSVQEKENETPTEMQEEEKALAALPFTYDPKSGKPVKLYQYEVCPFCTKVRMFLYYHKIPFETIEVDPLRKTELKEIKEQAFGKEKVKVPLIEYEGQFLHDSTQIIRTLYTQKYPGVDISEKEEEWIQFTDERLIRYVSPMIYDSWSGAFKTFQYIGEHSKFPIHTRILNTLVGGVMMHLITNLKLKKKYNIIDVDGEYQQLIHDWTVYGLEYKDFHGGSSPDLADLIVFGPIAAMIRCREDLTDEILKNEAAREWFRRVHNAIEERIQDLEFTDEEEYETEDEAEPVIKVVGTTDEKRMETHWEKLRTIRAQPESKAIEEPKEEPKEAEKEKEYARVRNQS